jgi:hypothetical protein
MSFMIIKKIVLIEISIKRKKKKKLKSIKYLSFDTIS